MKDTKELLQFMKEMKDLARADGERRVENLITFWALFILANIYLLNTFSSGQRIIIASMFLAVSIWRLLK